jgi:hypothetical protein
MKIIQYHQEQFKQFIEELLADSERVLQIKEHYEAIQDGSIKCNDKELRFRWDIQKACRNNQIQDVTIWFDEVYKYANDSHIDTLLRKLVKEVVFPKIGV